MAIPEQTLSFPSAKRRCWDLIIVRNNDCSTDSKAAVEEADVLDAFRKKYTSAKKVVFKPAIDPNFLDADGTHVPKNKDPTKSAIGSPNANERRVCVQVEFAGPQPIKGPAEVLCGLLGGASVAATPVFLARGRRKKKPKMCFVSDEEPAVVADEMVCSGVVDADNIGTGGSSKDCVGDGELEQETAAATAAESGPPTVPMLPETSWDSMPLWNLAPAPAEIAAADEYLLEWGDIAHRTGKEENDMDNDDGTFLCPSSTADMSTSPSSMSLLSGFRSSSSGLSTWEDYDCDTGMPQQETPAGLFETAFQAAGKPASQLFSPARGEDAATTGGVSGFGRAEFSEKFPGMPVNRDHRADTTSSCSSGSSLEEQRMHSRSDVSVAPAVSDGSINCVGDLSGGKAGGTGASRGAAVPSPGAASAATTFGPLGSSKEGGPGDQSWEWWSVKRESRGWRRSAAGETIGFGWLRQECDFEGRPTVKAEPSQGAKLSTKNTGNNTSTVDKSCRLAFKGLDSTSYKLRDLSVHARFSASSTGNVVQSVATPLEADGGGHADVKKCTVQYPSFEVMWPEMYKVRQILVIEVDMVVEVRSSDGKCLYTGPSIKVTYRRPKMSPEAAQAQQCTRVSSRDVLSNSFGQRRPGVYPAAATCQGGCQSPKEHGECSCCTGRVVLGSPSSPSVGTMILPPEDSFAALLI